MEDSRKEKREKEFFALPNFNDTKKQREGYYVSLRKKKRSDIFMEKRKIIFNKDTAQKEYDDGFLEYNDLDLQHIKDFKTVGLTPNDSGWKGFEKI